MVNEDGRSSTKKSNNDSVPRVHTSHLILANIILRNKRTQFILIRLQIDHANLFHIVILLLQMFDYMLSQKAASACSNA